MQVTIQGFADDDVQPGTMPFRFIAGAPNMAEVKAIAHGVCSSQHLIEIYWEREDAGILRLAKWNPKSQRWLDFARNIAIALQESEDADR